MTFGSFAVVCVASAELTSPGAGSSVFVAAPARDGFARARTRSSGRRSAAPRRFIALRPQTTDLIRGRISRAIETEVCENGRRDVAQGPLLALVGRLRAAADEEQRPEAVVGVEGAVAAAARVGRAAPVDRLVAVLE